MRQLTAIAAALATPASAPGHAIAYLSTDDLVGAVRCSSLAFVSDALKSGVVVKKITGSVDVKNVLSSKTSASFGFKIPFNVVEFGPTGEATSSSSATVKHSYDVNLDPKAAAPPRCATATVRGVDAYGEPLQPISAKLFTADQVLAAADKQGVRPSNIEIDQDLAVTKTGSTGLKIDLKVFTAGVTPLQGSTSNESSYKVTFDFGCQVKNSMGFAHICKPSK